MLVKAFASAALLVLIASQAVAAGPRANAGSVPMQAAPVDDADDADAPGVSDPANGQAVDASPFGPLALRPATDPKVDESALRYYAAQKDRRRVDAEIRRLRALYPRWSPPHNLYSPAGNGAGEQPLWDLFAAGKLEELRARIAQRMAKEPGWSPSYDLKTKIERREIRDRLVAASETRQWQLVLELARGAPAILSCADIDAVWRVAEASAQSGEAAQATAIYRSILTACTDPAERLTTVRKAIALLPSDEIAILIALGGRNADGSGEFDVIRVDMIRSRIAIAINAAGKLQMDYSPQSRRFEDSGLVVFSDGCITEFLPPTHYRSWQASAFPLSGTSAVRSICKTGDFGHD